METVTSDKAILNAIKLKKEVLKVLQVGSIMAETDKIISKVSDHPVEVAYLMDYCHRLDQQFGTSLVIELKVELEIRHENNKG